MDNVRVILYGFLLFFGVLLYQAWQVEHAPPPLVVAGSNATPELPVIATNGGTLQNQAVPLNTPVSKITYIENDVLKLAVDLSGGDIVSAELLQFKKDPKRPEPLPLLSQKPGKIFVAQSRLISERGPDKVNFPGLYLVRKDNLKVGDHQKALELVWRNKQGVEVTKKIILTEGAYTVDVDYTVVNDSITPYSGQIFYQLKRQNDPTHTKGIFSFNTFFGAAITTPDKPFKKISFKSMQDTPINIPTKGGWAGMMQHYFLSAWIPDPNENYTYYSHVYQGDQYIIGMASQRFELNPRQSAHYKSKIYIGPEVVSTLEKVAPHLKLTVDYGILWPISVFLFWVLKWFHYFVGNWGWAIVLLTLSIKLSFYKLTAASFRSMARLRQLQPKMQALKERYAEDKEKMGRAVMELYKKEKINPLGGCLPILIQLPFFIGLYYVLMESVELRQAPFIFWIHDLSLKDPFYVLPLLMGVSMILQQKLSPAPPDPTQAKVMMMMPVIFTVLFLSFPAGLVLYWVVNNSLSILQQWWINSRLQKEGLK